MSKLQKLYTLVYIILKIGIVVAMFGQSGSAQVRPNTMRNNTHTTQILLRPHKVAPEHITALKVSVSGCLLLVVFGCFIDLKGVGMFSGGRPRKNRILLPLLLGVAALLCTVLLWTIV